jgi:hypothetical protein
MNFLSYLLWSRTLAKEEEEQIRLQIHDWNLMINQMTRSAANIESYVVLPANGGNWGEYKAYMKYIKSMDGLATSVRCTCFP